MKSEKLWWIICKKWDKSQ